jgi:hypothetical protein
MSKTPMPPIVAALSPAVRRLVAVGAFLVIVALVFKFAVRPALHWSSSSVDAWADASFVMVRSRSAADSLAGLSPAVVEQEEADIRRLLLPGDSEADAAAALQSAVTDALGGPGIAVEALAVEPSREEGGLWRVQVGWRGSGEELAVLSALARLEQSRPLLRADRLIVRVASIEGASSRLALELRISGFWAAPLVRPPEPMSAQPASDTRGVVRSDPMKATP